MRLSQLIKKRRLTRFSSAVPLLTDVYVAAHNWNADDYIGEVYKRKRDYVVNKLLILNIKNNKFEGNVRYKYVLDDHGYPYEDPETGEQAKELYLEESDVNLIELIQYMVNELQEIAIIPDELLIAAGIEPPKDSILTDPLTKTFPQVEFFDAIEDIEIECNSSSASKTNAESENSFKCKNHFWDIVYAGEHTLVKDSLGIQYVAYLMLHKHNLIDWADLIISVKGVDPDHVDSGTSFEDVSKGFNLSQGKTGSTYAGKDIIALRREIDKLKDKQEEERDFGNDDVVDTIQDEIEDINKYILDTYRPNGTLKESAPAMDKMINSIKAAIKRAIADIEKGIPELGRHLTDSIVLKWQRLSPSYSPSIDIEWEL